MFDFTPLYRSTVGFDRLADMLGDAGRYDVPAYPPYNIERMDEDNYRISMAVAGFGRDELNIEVKENTLTISGSKETETETEKDKSEFLHRGIAQRGFERQFQLADHMQVTGADMENGLLHVTLKREIPEAMKPRTIAIGAPEKVKTIEGKKAA